MKKILVLMLISCLFLTGCGKKEIKFTMKSEDNYEFRISARGNIKGESFKKEITIMKYNDELKILEDDEVSYYVFNNKAYKDKHKKEKLKEEVATDFSFLYNIIHGKKRILEKDEDLIANKSYTFYVYEESKKNMRNLFETLNIDLNPRNKSEAILYLYNTDLYNIRYNVKEDNEEYEIKIDYFSFNSVGKIYEEYVEDSMEDEAELKGSSKEPDINQYLSDEEINEKYNENGPTLETNKSEKTNNRKGKGKLK